MTAPDDPRAARLEALIERLENYYDFHCEGGPLKLCVEWQQLKAAALSGSSAAPQSTMTVFDSSIGPAPSGAPDWLAKGEEIMREGVLPKSFEPTAVPRPPSESQPTTTCAFCGYSEYVVGGDWTRALTRREDHEAQCNKRPADPIPLPRHPSEAIEALKNVARKISGTATVLQRIEYRWSNDERQQFARLCEWSKEIFDRISEPEKLTARHPSERQPLDARLAQLRARLQKVFEDPNERFDNTCAEALAMVDELAADPILRARPQQQEGEEDGGDLSRMDTMGTSIDSLTAPTVAPDPTDV